MSETRRRFVGTGSMCRSIITSGQTRASFGHFFMVGFGKNKAGSFEEKEGREKEMTKIKMDHLQSREPSSSRA